jgi:hypothetical protein
MEWLDLESIGNKKDTVICDKAFQYIHVKGGFFEKWVNAACLMKFSFECKNDAIGEFRPIS